MYERFHETHQPVAEMLAPDFAWDMSTFVGWPEDPVYYATCLYQDERDALEAVGLSEQDAHADS